MPSNHDGSFDGGPGCAAEVLTGPQLVLPDRGDTPSELGSTHQATLIDPVRPLCPPTPPTRFRFLNAPIEPDEIGRLGNYRVLRLLGQGGMAFVFLAEDIGLHRRVALKLMKPDLESDPTACQRFLREARTLASIKHDNVVTVYQVGQEDRIVYLAMELLHGETLDDWVGKHGPANATELVRIGREIALGLDTIHQNGLVHRDLKPSNLWREEQGGRVKLLDFGLARAVHDDVKFTSSGYIVGTPAFMSPEQARGERVDARSDLFSLGGVLYFLGSGQLPFQAETTMGMLTALAVGTPRPLREINPRMPEALADLIMQLLRKTVADRPVSAREVAERLQAIEERGVMPAIPMAEAVKCDANAPTVALAAETKAIRKGPFQTARSVLGWVCLIAVGAFIVSGIRIKPMPREGPEQRPLAANDLVAMFKAELDETKLKKALPAPAPEVEPRKIPAPGQKKALAESKYSPAPVAKAPSAANVVFLTDLNHFASSNWIKAPPAPPDRPPMPFLGVSVEGKRAEHGIFMHGSMDPNDPEARVMYRLARQFNTFRARVALNDGPPRSESPMIFQVFGDGKPLWGSRPISTQADTQSCEVSVKGVETLELVLGFANGARDNRGTHGAWLDPSLSK
jgi:eukaryotic-like serine/threonine-protein kinase